MTRGDYLTLLNQMLLELGLPDLELPSPEAGLELQPDADQSDLGGASLADAFRPRKRGGG
jgi:hypothetical protein